MGNVIDLTGRKFGKLTVIERGENSNDGHVRWWCKCECGNPELILVYGTKLINNKIEKKYFGEYAYRIGEDNWHEKQVKN